MPAPSWATPAQLEFLESQRVAFAAAQENRKLNEFWTTIKHDFFTQWPNAESEVTPPADQSSLLNNKKKRKKKLLNATVPPPAPELSLEEWTEKWKANIYHWFNNHGLNKSRRAGKVKSVQLAIQPSGSRTASEDQIYSKRYYDTRVKPLVDKAILEQDANAESMIAIRARITAEVYAKESEEVKAEIRREKAARKKAKQALNDAMKTIVNAIGELTPNDYLLSQTVLPDLAQDFCDLMYERTRWSMTVIAGGPDPALGGNIRTIAVHHGQNVYGKSFGKAYTGFGESVLVPFSTFLQSVYSPSMRDTFRLDYIKPEVPETDKRPSAPAPEASTTTRSPGPENGPTKNEQPSPLIAESKGMLKPSAVSPILPLSAAPTTTEPVLPSLSPMTTTPMSAQPILPSLSPTTTTQTITQPILPLSAAPTTTEPILPSLSPTTTAQTIAQPILPLSAAPTTTEPILPSLSPMTTAQTITQPILPSSNAAHVAQPFLLYSNPTMSQNITHPFSSASNPAIDAIPNVWKPFIMSQTSNNSNLPASSMNTTMREGNGYTLANTPINASTSAGISAVGGISSSSGFGLGYAPTGPVGYPSGVLHDSMVVNQGWRSTSCNWDVSGFTDPFQMNDQAYTLNSALFSGGNCFVDVNANRDWKLLDNIFSSDYLGDGNSDVMMNLDLIVPPEPAPDCHTSQLQLPPQIPLSPPPNSLDSPATTSTPQPTKNPEHLQEEPKPEEKKKRGASKGKKERKDEKINENRGPRTRKPAVSKEVVPLIEKDLPTSQAWLTTAMGYLKEGVDDIAWLECVEAWFSFEEATLSDSSSHRLPAKMRPAALSRWLQTRKYPPPPIDDKHAFAVEWIKWWSSIQPTWRQAADPNSLPLPLSSAQQGENVATLRKAGPSGLITVMISLKWWAGTEGDNNCWKEAVIDVKGCLESAMVLGTKRKAIGQMGGRVKKTKTV